MFLSIHSGKLNQKSVQDRAKFDQKYDYAKLGGSNLLGKKSADAYFSVYYHYFLPRSGPT